MTKNKADFENSCTNYVKDKKEYLRKRESLLEEITNSYSKDQILGWYYDARGVFSTIKTDQFQSIPDKKEFRKSKQIGYLLIFLSIITAGIILNELKNIPTFTNLLALLSFPTFLLIFGIYTILNKKILFSWNEYSIKFKNMEIFYNDIVLMGKVNSYTGGGIAKDSIVIGTKSKGIVEFNTVELDICPEEIAEIIKRKTLPNTV